MVETQNSRLERVYGKEPLEILRNSHVAVFGVGGVGGYVVEALARSGVGSIDIIDKDVVSISNLNRQIIATHDTIDRLKVEVCKERIHSINPDIVVNTYPVFYLPEKADAFDFSKYDYVVDAIDNVTAKIDIIMQCQKAGTPVISSMGCGNRVDPTKLAISDIYKTSMDPLAKTIRREMKKRGVKKLKVLYSTEPPIRPILSEEEIGERKISPGSTPFVPAAGGLTIAAEVVKDLTKFDPSVRQKGGKQ